MFIYIYIFICFVESIARWLKVRVTKSIVVFVCCCGVVLLFVFDGPTLLKFIANKF